jgi:hypothetical protein
MVKPRIELAPRAKRSKGAEAIECAETGCCLSKQAKACGFGLRSESGAGSGPWIAAAPGLRESGPAFLDGFMASESGVHGPSGLLVVGPGRAPRRFPSSRPEAQATPRVWEF